MLNYLTNEKQMNDDNGGNMEEIEDKEEMFRGPKINIQ